MVLDSLFLDLKTEKAVLPVSGQSLVHRLLFFFFFCKSYGLKLKLDVIFFADCKLLAF